MLCFRLCCSLFKSFLLWSALFFAAYVCDPSDDLEGPWSAGSDTGRNYQPRSGEETGSERGSDLPVVAQPGRSESGNSSGVPPRAPISSTSTSPLPRQQQDPVAGAGWGAGFSQAEGIWKHMGAFCLGGAGFTPARVGRQGARGRFVSRLAMGVGGYG